MVNGRQNVPRSVHWWSIGESLSGVHEDQVVEGFKLSRTSEILLENIVLLLSKDDTNKHRNNPCAST